jgi:DNA helicase-2/ATP-dependent DNA helicase PcrA
VPEIACGHCGGVHGSVAEVRSCALSGEHGELTDTLPPPIEPPDDLGTRSSGSFDSAISSGPRLGTYVSPSETMRVGIAATPGPAALARNLVTMSEAPVPEPWTDVNRFVIDDDLLASSSQITDLANELQRRWANRERFVVELVAEFDETPSTVLTDESWQLGPGVDLGRDRLFFVVWANSIRLMADGELTFPLLEQAVELGAHVAGTQHGDVLLADQPTWLDGGPLDLSMSDSIGAPVLHAITLDAGSITPLGDVAPHAELAPDQLEAVAHSGGPARIIAPAGSGKTRVLTERARHLLADRQLPPSVVTLVAFNKRAQVEMLERTPDLHGLRVRTLNALALAIVNGTDRFATPSVVPQRVQTIGERDVRNMLRRFIELPRKTNTDPMAAWIEALTATRLGLRDPKLVEEDFAGDVDGLVNVVGQYRESLRRQNLVDFDEQIMRAIEVLLTDPVARRQAQSTCRLLLVDEFQDLTPAHLMLVRLLAGPRGDVFGVGDDDQTIYGFTGASPEWLVNYERWFPHATNHALEVNYRCAPAVIEGARTLLERNRTRVKKVIRAPEGRDANDGSLELVKAPNPLSAATERISDLLSAGVAPTDIVVLSRVNVALAAPQIALLNAGAPACATITVDLLQRTGVRALLAWLRLANNPGSITPADISETVRRPSRGLSRRVQEWMGEHTSVRDLRKLARRMSDRDQAKIDEYLDDIELLADRVAVGSTTEELVRYVGDEIGLGGALGSLDSARRAVDRSTHLDDLDAMAQLGGVQTDPELFENWLRSELDRPGTPEGEGILLSTVHKVKGQEWPHVIVVGANQGTFPHRLADTEEERRVFHVAITRSSDTTVVIADAARPSQFLGETDGTAPKPVLSSGASTASARRLERREVQAVARKISSHLVDSLKAWRLDRSRTEGMPAYMVFSDATLDEIAAAKPSSLKQLGRVKGIGPKKLSDYGETIIELVAAHS